MTLRHGSDKYEIVVENPDGVCEGITSARYDGIIVDERPLRLELRNDGETHKIRIILGSLPS